MLHLLFKTTIFKTTIFKTTIFPENVIKDNDTITTIVTKTPPREEENDSK